MSRHQRHRRLLDHLARLGYEVVKVTNGENTCKVRTIIVGDNRYHQFILLPRDKVCFVTPPLIPLLKSNGAGKLEFTVRDMKTGQILKIYTWKCLANFVERKELEKQTTERLQAE